MKKAYLILNNGTVFEGFKIGADTECTGEVVFSTGMGGYIEALTDPSYAGQILVETFPVIGSYGVMSADAEGKCALNGIVVRELCDEPSNFRSEGKLDDFLKAQGVCGLCGIDTRSLTKLLRTEGVMNGRISDTPVCDMQELGAYTLKNAVAAVSAKEKYICKAVGEKKHSVALIDYGTKKSIIDCLCFRGCEVTVYPHNTTAEEILAADHDGIMLSSGPGAPAENTQEITELKKLLGKKPVFGVCLGHLLAALALGGSVTKLKHGHHGENQPVIDTDSHRIYITSQSHGYAVDAESLKDIGIQSCINANDRSCEGMSYPSLNAFTVQFHPEANAGPHDTEFLFDRFVSMMEDN